MVLLISNCRWQRDPQDYMSDRRVSVAVEKGGSSDRSGANSAHVSPSETIFIWRLLR